MDMNQRAHRTVMLATGQIAEDKPKGRAKGGLAAAANMTAEERSERARKAAKARWDDSNAAG